MTVQELIQKLQEFPPNCEVAIFASQNIGELHNIFPQEVIKEDDSDIVEICI